MSKYGCYFRIGMDISKFICRKSRENNYKLKLQTKVETNLVTCVSYLS